MDEGKVGIADDFQETSRDVAFCAHTILNNDVFIVPDATKDERFCENPLVTDSLNIRFYAGAPIVSTTGYRLGSICIIDNEPREMSKEDARMISIISQQISKLLELRLKNKLLKQKAEEQLKMEKLLLLKTLQEHEMQKQTISTELHENIAQTLAATKFYLELAEGPAICKVDLIQKCKENITSLVIQVRELSQSIAPSLLKEVELKMVLTNLLSQFYNRSGIEVKLQYEGRTSIASEPALIVYRIVEEQLENVCRHSGAGSVVVTINVCESIYISILDNGCGIDLARFQKGVGINKIASKVESLGGSVEITAGVKGGCELVVTIPKSNVRETELC